MGNSNKGSSKEQKKKEIVEEVTTISKDSSIQEFS